MVQGDTGLKRTPQGKSCGSLLPEQFFLRRSLAPRGFQHREQGKTRFIGITAIGETAALHQVIASGAFDSAQVPYNALNPSPAADLPANYPAQDYDRLMERAVKAGMGTIGIRVLAGGALSGSEERHPLNVQSVEPIGSATGSPAPIAAAIGSSMR